MGLADKIVVRFGSKGKSPMPGSTGDEPESAPGDADETPGTKGRMLAKAIESKDGEAIEEAVKAICA